MSDHHKPVSVNEKRLAPAITTLRGGITRQFTITCNTCEQYETYTSTGIDNAIKDMEANGWRLTRDHGWYHKKCCKMMPLRIKL